MTIDLVQYLSNKNYFIISINNDDYYSSESISELLNLDLDLYNNLLINKVVKHPSYAIGGGTHKDLEFNSNSISRETYINRFKEAFSDQLILLTLGGN